jgi:trehalose 6-phosphate phosphatase
MKSQCRRIWAFDFDGTISQLVPEREMAVLDSECKSLISALADDPRHVVAVISSRHLDDLIGRIEIDNVILAGSSGLEWRVPGIQRIGPNSAGVERLERERSRLVPTLRQIGLVTGVEIEDKMWSAAVHFRLANPAARSDVAKRLGRLQLLHGVTIHYGPDVAEVQFLAEVSKELAVKTLIHLNAPSYENGNIVYAGDDQNDAEAMRWVLAQKGIAYVVGDRITVAGSHRAESPADLARAVRHDFQINIQE